MNKEEILYNEIYERTKDFGRTHFIKEIMRLQREYKQLKEIEKEHQRINGELRVGNKELQDRIDKAVEIIESEIKEVKKSNDLVTHCLSIQDLIDEKERFLDLLKGDKE